MFASETYLENCGISCYFCCCASIVCIVPVMEVVLYHRFARVAANEQHEKRDQLEQRADHEAFQHRPVLFIHRKRSAQQLAHVQYKRQPLQLEHKPASEWAHATCRLLFPVRRFALT